ncbi:hypothetical protein COZ39_04415 [Candidatus Roizmanbacteria bacterium CG_4_10_14_3_um_filter_33_21]|uniref:Metallo-beta-lactamase domain-containing protein n=4 Tax=Candidatus Roizmaniibacteriota TaxID=1752723 RepID=A0A2M7E587_9BACT|nr:MBL fold metallo-hydrolase [Candidatus Roizmanbacteria bacterium]PIV62883.1 MAG: hypothetical protein COS12_00665 [Candidatus Roizmanbacteria bacterium CG01_land_8_20_14_3_00_33_9]PIX70634.1 MAG: hypothetical protein COZ39_04415 [Candidatus Roizmanbacteria bacterium CG_4_10_14_3_um_filter_33_21]
MIRIIQNNKVRRRLVPDANDANMQIISFSLGELQANCYLLIKDKECLLIDPADDANFLLEEITRRNLKLVGLLATHGHFDHIMAVGEIQLTYPEIPLYINLKDEFLLDRLQETAEYFLGHKIAIIKPKKISAVPENELKIFRLAEASAKRANFKIKIILSPGHTPGSVCFYFADDKILFSGDLIFKDGIGRYDFSYSNKKQLFDSINLITKTIPEDVIIYSGHGEKTTIKTFKTYWNKIL